MGEYALHEGEQIKIGTCESMYYLRFDDRHKVNSLPNNTDPGNTDGLRFRLPFPDEDHVRIGHYEQHNRGIRLYRTVERQDQPPLIDDWSEPEAADAPGIVQLRHPSGLLVNVACFHGIKLPEAGGDVRSIHWNGKTSSFELSSVKPLEGELWGVVRCRHCEKAWRFPLVSLLEWVPDQELRRRLAAYLEIEKRMSNTKGGLPAAS